jgi:hypothetical protein
VSLLDEAVVAHGGLDRWRAVREVEADIRSGGLALASKLAGGPFRSYRAIVSTTEPRTVLEPYPGAGRRGVFEGDRVRIESLDGDPLSERVDPRPAFRRMRRRLWWDRLDALYFAGYALWNYLNTPFLLLLDGIETREEGRRLHATFPPEIPTHSREQTFWFDERGLLERLDYTAEVFGGWARAAHLCRGHREVDGLSFPTSRRVVPRARSGRPRRGPMLVSIEIDRLELRRG